jgi:hypothetical protein
MTDLSKQDPRSIQHNLELQRIKRAHDDAIGAVAFVVVIFFIVIVVRNAEAIEAFLSW